jgi:hypothetical protein
MMEALDEANPIPTPQSVINLPDFAGWRYVGSGVTKNATGGHVGIISEKTLLESLFALGPDGVRDIGNIIGADLGTFFFQVFAFLHVTV